MAAAGDVVCRVLSWIVTFMFLMAGLTKTSPAVFPQMHAEMAKDFVHIAKVCPTAWIGYIPPAYIYMVTIGAWELFCVVGLFVQALRKTAHGILIVIMVGAVYSHIALGDYKGGLIPLFLLGANVLLFSRCSTQSVKLKTN